MHVQSKILLRAIIINWENARSSPSTSQSVPHSPCLLHPVAIYCRVRQTDSKSIALYFSRTVLHLLPPTLPRLKREHAALCCNGITSLFLAYVGCVRLGANKVGSQSMEVLKQSFLEEDEVTLQSCQRLMIAMNIVPENRNYMIPLPLLQHIKSLDKSWYRSG